MLCSCISGGHAVRPYNSTLNSDLVLLRSAALAEVAGVGSSAAWAYPSCNLLTKAHIIWSVGHFLLSKVLLTVGLLRLLIKILLTVRLLRLLIKILLTVRLLRLLIKVLLTVGLLRLLIKVLLSVGLLLVKILLSVRLLLTEILLSVRLLLIKILLSVSHSAHSTHIAHICVAVQCHNNLVRLLLVTSEFLGVAALGSLVGELKLNIAEIRRIYGDVNCNLVLTIVSRRIVRLPLALAVFAVNLGLVLLNLVPRAYNVRNLDNIGVLGAVVALAADYKLRLCVVNINLGVVAEHTGGVEVVEVLPVLLAVSKLSLDFVECRFFSAGKKR